MGEHKVYSLLFLSPDRRRFTLLKVLYDFGARRAQI